MNEVKDMSMQENPQVEVIGVTVFSGYADLYDAEHISIEHFLNGNINVAFKHEGHWITNNALGILVIFKVVGKKHRHFYLPKDQFEKKFFQVDNA